MTNEQIKQKVIAFIQANNNNPHACVEKFGLTKKTHEQYQNGIKKVGYYAGDLLCFEVHEA